MTEIEKAKAVWRICANVAIPLSGSDRAQIANSFKAMIEKAEQAEGFEAFKREVSDFMEEIYPWTEPGCSLSYMQRERILHFILPKPVDPLVEALCEVRDNPCIRDTAEIANDLRAALAKRGLEVREIEG